MWFYGSAGNTQMGLGKYDLSVIIAALILFILAFAIYKKYNGEKYMLVYTIFSLISLAFIPALFDFLFTKIDTHTAVLATAALVFSLVISALTFIRRFLKNYRTNSIKNYKVLNSLSASLISGTSSPSDLEKWEGLIKYFEDDYFSVDKEKILSTARSFFSSYLVKHYPDKLKET